MSVNLCRNFKANSNCRNSSFSLLGNWIDSNTDSNCEFQNQNENDIDNIDISHWQMDENFCCISFNSELNRDSGGEKESKYPKSPKSYVTAFYSSQQLHNSARSSGCAATKSKDEGAFGFVDSCSTHVLTRVAEDMDGFDSETPNARVSGVSGLVSEQPVGWTGTLKSNDLELRRAIFYGDLPVDRVMSTEELYKAGWRTVLDGPESRLENRKTGELRKVIQGEGSLPLASIGFRKDGESDTQTLLTEAAEYKTPTGATEMSTHRGKRPKVDAKNRSASTNKSQVNMAKPKTSVEIDNECQITPTKACCILTKLEQHYRRLHLSSPGTSLTRTPCEACALSKGGKKSCDKTRKVEYNVAKPLEQLNTDFYGPIDESVRKFTILIVFIDDCCGATFVIPLRARSDNVAVVEALVKQLRAEFSTYLGEKCVCRVRSDNDTTYRSDAWNKVLQTLETQVTHSIPYNPGQNGVAERFMSTMGHLLRACLVGVDKRVWCYAAEAISWVWCRTANTYTRAPKYNGLSPIEALKARNMGDEELAEYKKGAKDRQDRWVANMRRFGCVSYVYKQPADKIRKLQEKYRKVIFLGCSQNNHGWLFGYRAPHKGRLSGTQWTEIE